MKLPEKQIQKHYQTILDSIADGVFTVDLDLRITSFNKGSETITGISREEAIGKPCFEILKASTCKTKCFIKQTIKEKTPIVNMPVYILRPDKKRIPISVTTALLKDSKGKIIGGVETFRDLSIVDKLRKALRRQHSFDDIVSKSGKMLDLFSILPQIAESNSTVLITGASGTGKELFARAIHNNSQKKKGHLSQSIAVHYPTPFVKLSFSDTKPARSPMLKKTSPVDSRWPKTERFSWTKSEISQRLCRSAFSVFWRIRSMSRWGLQNQSQQMQG